MGLLLEFESACTPSGTEVCFATLAATVFQVGLLRRLVSTGNLRETTSVTDDGFTAFLLASVPLHAGSSASADLLDFVFVV